MKVLSINDLEAEGRNSPKPVWVLNSSAESVIQKTGDVILTIPKRTGNDKDLLTIRATWLPQNLTTDVTRQQLLGSSEFRKAISSKLLTIIDDKSAQKLLSDEGADIEQQRLDAEDQHVREASGARAISAEVKQISGEDSDDPQDENQVKHQLVNVVSMGDSEESIPGIETSFQMWTDKLMLAKTDMEMLNMVKAKRSFSSTQLTYLSSRVKMPRTLQFIKANLKVHAERKAAKKAAA